MNLKIPGGFYIVIEGGDGCGKTTQCELLYNKLSKEYGITRIREPGGTPLGDKIRELLLNKQEEELSAITELLLFSASRCHSIEKLVMPALDRGEIVLSDRNYFSTLAYQGAGGEISAESILAISKIATLGINPNLAFIIDINAEEGLRRARRDTGGDKIESRDLKYHKRVREAYLQIASFKNCKLIDGSVGIENIHHEIYEIVKLLITPK
ncbi:MAG: dTMP kinase [Candidatus Pacearchaeota archaeon]